MRKFLALLLALSFFGLFASSASARSVINPIGGNAWDLYVFGNGQVAYDIFTSVKMLMVPDAGTTGFGTLLLLLATVGFIVLAVAAGFDPGKHLIRMFVYVIAVWGVTLFSTQITANLQIDDVLAGAVGASEPISGVPAIVAMPAALTSQVGWYFNRTIETYFSTPNDFKLSGAAAGQFNLFNKMMKDSTEFRFTDPAIGQTVGAYVTNCVIPAIAQGKFVSTDAQPGTNPPAAYTGMSALLNTTDYLGTLASAQNQAIMTPYFPAQGDNPKDYADLSGTAGTSGTPGMGILGTCTAVYGHMVSDVKAYASNLLNATSEQWSQSGVNTPFETEFKSMIAAASAQGSSAANYSSPSGIIIQNAFINSNSDSLRQAAVLTGNNSLMQATALAQAEQSQRSTWASSFTIFNNMMGYVFTVLQSFIFAIAPMVVVALMIPGLGKSVFTNYMQILVWLTLWSPMLGVINYIMTLFGIDATQGIIGAAGGVNTFNSALISEKTANLIIAGQFLGTMVPLITWGLVKGTLAFTEFISHGIGSAFSNQAGASAATGNISMDNMSMDNTSMNKYNTAMSSTVGTQATNAFANAGALLVGQDAGGGSVTASGQAMSAQKAFNNALSSKLSAARTASEIFNASQQHGSSIEDVMSRANSTGNSQVKQAVIADILSATQAYARTHNAGHELSNKQLEDIGKKLAEGRYADANSEISASLGVKIGGTGAGGKLSHGGGSKTALDDTAGSGQAGAEGDSAGSGVGTTQGGSSGKTGTTSSSQSQQSGHTQDAGHRESAVDQEIFQHALQRQTSMTSSLEAATQVSSGFSMGSDMDFAKANSLIGELDTLTSGMSSETQLKSEMAGLMSKATNGDQQAMARYEAIRGQAQNEYGHLQPSSGGDVQGQINTLGKKVAGGHAAAQADVTAAHKALVDKNSVLSGNVKGKQAAGPTQRVSATAGY